MPEPGEALIRAGITPSHPGGFFLRRIVLDRGRTLKDAAREMDIDLGALSAFVAETRPLDSVLATRLARYAGTSVAFWMNMQAASERARG